nr:hypothetical protein GCM10025730_31000 [Promicromonospora thailandica]
MGESRHTPGSGRSIDREILALAIPALGALVAEPVFVLVDSAVVGHLGTAELAGLSLASNVLLTVVGLCIFLAYTTTASVARLTGAGKERAALQSGIDGLWLALGIGAVLAVGLLLAAPATVTALGADGDVARQAVTYLRWSAPASPGCSWCRRRPVCCAACATRAPRWSSRWRAPS